MQLKGSTSRMALAALAAIMLSGTPGWAKQASEPVRINSFSGAFLAARVAEVDNDLDDAIAYYKRALAFDPDNQAMQQSLMLALLADGQFDEGAAARFRAFSSNGPTTCWPMAASCAASCSKRKR